MPSPRLRFLLLASGLCGACGDDGGESAGPSTSTSGTTTTASASSTATTGTASASSADASGSGGSGGSGGEGGEGGQGGEGGRGGAGGAEPSNRLRLTELGTCADPYDSCWLEVHNVSTVEVDLADFALRSSAVRPDGPGGREPHDFALPSLAIPADGYALVRGDSYDGLHDGPQVVHVHAAGFVPSWTGSGFVEILRDGVTVDFVRFGDDDQPPTTADAWSDVGATELPSNDDDYGRSLARDRDETDTDGASDWTLRAWATAGGPNDIDDDADDDGDGIPDQAERQGGTYAGLDLHAMGLREDQRDILVQIDHMEADDPATVPRREALEKVVSAFAARDIALHLDVGDLYTGDFDPAAFNLGGGEVVPHATSLVLDYPIGQQKTLYEYKAAHFDVRLQAVSHYVVWGTSQELDGSAGFSGHAEIVGNDLVVTLGGWGLSDVTPDAVVELYNLQAATFMHELGHNLSLLHGGDGNANSEPNYVSIMNYLYQTYGLPEIGAATEGDRYLLDRNYYLGDDCGLTETTELARGPFDPDMVIDYSDGASDPLIENDLDESEGLRRPGSAPVDWTCDGDTDDEVALDISFDGVRVTLTDHDDWAAVTFVFSRHWHGADNGAVRRFAPLGDDRQATIAERAPPPGYLAERRRLRQMR